MQSDNPLEIMKEAILLEKRGKSFYKKVAEQAQNKAVADFFKTMAEEEHKHIQILSRQFKSYSQNKTFLPETHTGSDASNVSSQVLTPEIKENISAAGFEAAAISAAISMEERAVKLYSESAKTSPDPEAKTLYRWLADWERQHLNTLLDIDRDLKKQIWHDNKFWPF